MRYNIFILGGLLFMGVLRATGQCEVPEVSTDHPLETAEDYIEVQGDVEKALEWLCVQPLDQCVSEREQLNSFVMLWLSGSPHVVLEFNPEVTPFLKDDPELLFPMLHGMALELLKRRNATPYDLYAGGLRTVDRLTRELPRKSKSPELKALHKAVRKGDIRAYLARHCVACIE